MKNAIVILLTLFFCSCGESNKPLDPLNLKEKLSGKWKTTAFSGELHEEWHLNKDGWMTQQGHYIEDSDTSYSAVTKIEKVDEDVILFSVIKNSNPKIFKAISVKEHEIVFENKDYKNPFQVKYEFFDSKNYKRTIRGYEKDSLVIYEFKFEKIK